MRRVLKSTHPPPETGRAHALPVADATAGKRTIWHERAAVTTCSQSDLGPISIAAPCLQTGALQGVGRFLELVAEGGANMQTTKIGGVP